MGSRQCRESWEIPQELGFCDQNLEQVWTLVMYWGGGQYASFILESSQGPALLRDGWVIIKISDGEKP